MSAGTLLWVLIGGGVIVLALAAILVLRVMRSADDEADLPDPVPVTAAPRPAVPRNAPDAAAPVVPAEPSLYTYPGRRAGWWVCPNCECENEPDRTHCGVCLWDRTVGVE